MAYGRMSRIHKIQAIQPKKSKWKKRKQRSESNEFEEKFQLCWWNLSFTHKRVQRAFDAYFFDGRKRSLTIWCIFAILFFTPWVIQQGFVHPSTIYEMVHMAYLLITLLIAIISLVWMVMFKSSSNVAFLTLLNFACVAIGMPILTFAEIPSSDPIIPPLLFWCYIVWYGIFIGYVIILHVDFLLFWLGNILFFGSMAYATELMYKFECIGRLPASQLFWSATLSILMTAKIVHSALKSNCLIFKNLKKMQLKKEEDMKQKVYNLKRQYIAQTLHDIGTPLTTLMLGQEMFEQWELPEDLDDIVKTNNCALEMMVLTRKKALDYMKFEDTGMLVPHLAPTDLHHILHYKCKRIMTGFNSQNDVGLKFVIEDNVTPKVITDGDWIWEMMCNYLSNALKFTKYGSVEARISLSEDKDYLCFEVKDTGPGVDDEQKALLFKPFSQLQDDSGGTGLGLYSVSCKAVSLGGHAGVGDNLDADSGAVFYFTIPNRPFLEDYRSRVEEHVEQPPTIPSLQREKNNGTPTYLQENDNQKGLEEDDNEKGDDKQQEDVFDHPGDCSCTDTWSSFADTHKCITSPRFSKRRFKKSQNSSAKSLIFKGPLCSDMLDHAPQSNFEVQAQKENKGQHLREEKKDSPRIIDEHKVPTSRTKSSPVDSGHIPTPTPNLRYPASRSLDSSMSSNDMFFFKATSSPECSGRGKPLLLIEDEKSIAKFIIRMLSKYGYEVTHSENGLLGLEKMKGQRYHIVLCDITMPGIDGFETVSRFREWEAVELASNNRTQKQAIVALSASQIPEDQQKAISSGFNSFLSKPVKLKVLLAEIEKQTSRATNT